MEHHIVRAALRAALVIALALAAPLARAEDQGSDRPILGSKSPGNWPTEITKRPLTLNKGMVELWVPVNMNLSKGQSWEPVNLNPSLYYGVTDSWMVGIRHFVGVCVTGTAHGCGHVYNDVSLDTLLAFGGGGLQLGVGGALNYAPIHDDPAWSAEAKVAIRAGGGALALTLVPTVNFGLNARDRALPGTSGGVPAFKWTGTPLNLGSYNVLSLAPTPGNREFLLVPLTLQLQLGSNLALAASASLNGPLNARDLKFSDVYTIPVSVAAVVTPVRWVDVGAALTFPNLAGANFSGSTAGFTSKNGADQRELSVFLTARL